jgi:Tol biopolymer transport system component
MSPMLRRFAASGFCAVLCLAAASANAQFKAAPEGGFPPPAGRIAFVRDQDVWIMNPDGTQAKQLIPSGRAANRVAWSPDNSEILFCQDGFQQYQLPSGGGGKIKLYDIFAARANTPTDVKQITNDAMSASPSYFPGGDRIAFTRNLNTFDLTKEVPNFQVFVGGTYGNPKPRILNQSDPSPKLQMLSPSVSPDGKRIACVVTTDEVLTSPKQTLGIVLFPAEGYSGTAQECYNTAAKIPTSSGPAWSPDGSYLAYVDATSDPRSLALYDVAKGSHRVVYKPLKGFDLNTSPPSWSKDGNWIVFANAKGNILMVDKNGSNLKALTTGGLDAYPVFSN